MGKTSKWFRGLLGLIKPDNNSSSPSPKPPPKEKRRWSFVKSYREKDHHHHHHSTLDHHHHQLHSSGHVQGPTHPDNHAVEAATTTALAGGIFREEEWAAIKIQAAFRACLARRALRALKALVKLQALVRGHIERKRTAQWLQRMQALLRAQARVRAGRAQFLQASYWAAKPSTAHLHGPATPDKFESPIRSGCMKYSSSVLKRNGSKSRAQINGNQDIYENGSDSRVDEQAWNQRRSWTRTCSMDDERSVKILEIDSGKPHNITSKRRNLSYSNSQPLVWSHYSQSLTTTKDSTSYQSCQSPSSCEVRSYSPLKINQDEETTFYAAANNSPQILSTSSKDGGSKIRPFTPTRSDGSRSYQSVCPSYMAYTESSKAKVRSISAPKQRPQYERSSSSNRYSLHLHGLGESRLTTDGICIARKLH